MECINTKIYELSKLIKDNKLSNIASEIASHTLSGCPSETDSEVNMKSFLATLSSLFSIF